MNPKAQSADIVRMKVAPSKPQIRVAFAGQRDPQRITAWLRDLIARARAARAAEEHKAA
jgi:hypothetical protein